MTASDGPKKALAGERSSLYCPPSTYCWISVELLGISKDLQDCCPDVQGFTRVFKGFVKLFEDVDMVSAMCFKMCEVWNAKLPGVSSPVNFWFVLR